MEQPTNKLAAMSTTFGVISLAIGVLGIFSFFYPPAQLLCGAAAIILAYLSKNGKKMNVLAIIGIVLGVFSVLLSIFFFRCFIETLRFMDNPANVAAYNEAISQLMAQYGVLADLMNGLSTQ